ncbi:hypothetical protein [Pseudoclavibacter sp. AY1H1]|nr:hypothetical protein [Pseudoclavibacter sp. AY1H1]
MVSSQLHEAAFGKLARLRLDLVAIAEGPECTLQLRTKGASGQTTYG